MKLKEFWASTKSKTSKWLQVHKPSKLKDYPSEVAVDEDGLISQEGQAAQAGGEEQAAASDKVMVKAVAPVKKQESLEKLQEGFNTLIEQLGGIKEHLSRQVAQHEDLMSRLEQLPKFLESFPTAVESQKEITEQLLEELKTAAAKDEQFADAVERIPAETAKQTDALVNINHQLGAAADTDVQMADSFNKFNETLDKLNQSTVGQTDSIMQMSRTFATSDRYLKYLVSKQNRRFVWIFLIAIGVCVGVILILTGIIIYLKQYG
ncbi:MAG TPA: hypothetical protein VMW16_17085 [Sedimentisphaerales bacterium]|nr:hypothetical protein [Sedimentisphaerales bacterium]